MINSTERKIKVLKDEVINKIAAGEVVERPASIVKELVENAIDAGATRIKIDLEEGGKKSIVITDNGAGIPYDDLPLTVVRHATSKIISVEDLFSVGSMGFRGEALASISSVSDFSLLSKKVGEKKAYKLSFDETKEIPTIEEWAHPEGTSISVKDLFYNVPVRLKFLRSAQTEFSQCLEAVQALCLANPEQTFILTHNGQEKFLASSDGRDSNKKNFPFLGEETLRTRVAYLYGAEVSENLLYVTSVSDYLKIEALIAPPGLDKAISKVMYTFVNGRWVVDKVLRYGILRGYHSHLLKGRYPYVFCYITMSPELVDVNAHPSKTELRFQYADEVQGQIARTIRDALRRESWASGEEIKTSPENKSSLPSEKSGVLKSSLLSFSSSSRPKSVLFSKSEPIASRKPIFSGGSSYVKTHETASLSSYGSQEATFFLENAREEKSSWINWDHVQYVGTIQKCYLIFEVEEKLLFVDQHAFHERILYEKLCLDEKLTITSESLLIPETLSLGPTVVASLLEKKSALEKLSFSFEKISEEEIEVLRIPSLLTKRNLSEVFFELSENNNNSFTADEIHHQLLATIACHSAVRSGEILTPGKIELLKEEAKSVDFSANCPHGRRVFKWFSGSEMKGWFDRT